MGRFMGYPTSKSETIADGTVHVAGLLLAIPACAMLLMIDTQSETIWLAIAVYVASLLFALLASALYHMLPFDHIRPVLGRIDHAAIYSKIAGSYTPLVMLIGTGFAYGILCLVWAMAIFGSVAKLSFWRTDGRGSLALYLGMGWLSVLLIWPMLTNLPAMAVALVAIGGLIYSSGTWVYAHKGMRYQNAIWHVFVLVASICFFGAIALSVQSI